MRQNLRTRLTTYDYEAVALQFAQQPQKSCFQNKISEQRRHSHVYSSAIYNRAVKTTRRSTLIALWPRKMKIDCSRQTLTERTNKQTNKRTDISISWAPVGAKKISITSVHYTCLLHLSSTPVHYTCPVHLSV